ncbi:MAG: hypothetical protein AB7E30_09110, partial [Lawsonibacter sp.]
HYFPGNRIPQEQREDKSGAIETRIAFCVQSRGRNAKEKERFLKMRLTSFRSFGILPLAVGQPH